MSAALIESGLQGLLLLLKHWYSSNKSSYSFYSSKISVWKIQLRCNSSQDTLWNPTWTASGLFILQIKVSLSLPRRIAPWKCGTYRMWCRVSNNTTLSQLWHSGVTLGQLCVWLEDQVRAIIRRRSGGQAWFSVAGLMAVLLFGKFRKTPASILMSLT